MTSAPPSPLIQWHSFSTYPTGLPSTECSICLGDIAPQLEGVNPQKKKRKIDQISSDTDPTTLATHTLANKNLVIRENSHVFHKDCVEKYWKTNPGTCPTCKSSSQPRTQPQEPEISQATPEGPFHFTGLTFLHLNTDDKQPLRDFLGTNPPPSIERLDYQQALWAALTCSETFALLSTHPSFSQLDPDFSTSLILNALAIKRFDNICLLIERSDISNETLSIVIQEAAEYDFENAFKPVYFLLPHRLLLEALNVICQKIKDHSREEPEKLLWIQEQNESPLILSLTCLQRGHTQSEAVLTDFVKEHKEKILPEYLAHFICHLIKKRGFFTLANTLCAYPQIQDITFQSFEFILDEAIQKNQPIILKTLLTQVAEKQLSTEQIQYLAEAWSYVWRTGKETLASEFDSLVPLFSNAALKEAYEESPPAIKEKLELLFRSIGREDCIEPQTSIARKRPRKH